VAGLALPDGAPEALGSLRWLADRAPRPVAAALRLLAARLPGAAEEAEALLRKAFEDDATSAAGAALEQRLTESGQIERRFELLITELRAAERDGRAEVARALRFRLAHVAGAAGRLAEALGHLEPLRRGGDRLADAWSLDLTRQAGDARAEADLLHAGVGR